MNTCVNFFCTYNTYYVAFNICLVFQLCNHPYLYSYTCINWNCCLVALSFELVLAAGIPPHLVFNILLKVWLWTVLEKSLLSVQCFWFRLDQQISDWLPLQHLSFQKGKLFPTELVKTFTFYCCTSVFLDKLDNLLFLCCLCVVLWICSGCVLSKWILCAHCAPL